MATLKPYFNSHMSLIRFFGKRHSSIFMKSSHEKELKPHEGENSWITKKVAIAQMDVNPAIWQEVANVLNLREA